MIAAGDRREAASIGRRARLELVFAERHGRTLVAHAYAEPPFRPPAAFAESGGLHVIMTSSAPGLFGADMLDQTIIVQPGARVRLTSQSAVQVHPHVSAAVASLRSTCTVADGAALSCTWDPLIPFAGARLDQRVGIELLGDARLLWSDALMAGRVARGERWRFVQVAYELRVVRGGALEYLERFLLRPAVEPLTSTWIADGADYLGTAVASGVPGAAARAEVLHRELAALRGITAAADALAERVILVRLLSGAGVAFHHARSIVHAAIDRR